MAFRSITPSITINTTSGQLRTELLNTFARLDGELAVVPYRFDRQNGVVSNTGSAETDLFSTTVNAATLNGIGQSLIIFAAGKTAANGNNKTLKLVLGSTTLFTSGALALNDVSWTFHGEVVYNGGSSQIFYGIFNRSGGSPVIVTGTATEAFANTLTLKLTGTGTASSDISGYVYKVILLK